MNLFEKIICNQYAELKPRNKGNAARTNGVLLITLTIIFLAGIAVNIAVALLTKKGLVRFPQAIGDSGRMIGRFAALLLVIVIYPLVNLVYGKEERFRKTAEWFDSLPEAKRKRIAAEGMIFFFGSLLTYVVTIFLV